MKPIRNFVCAALFCIPFAIRAEEAGIGEGRVTIPYPELRALLDAVEEAADRKPDPIPPVDAALARARYRLDFSGSAPSLTADFQIDAFTDEWHSVPLLGGDLLLESATLTSGDASVIRRNGHYVLLAKGRGKFAATVSLGLPAPGEWEKGDGVVLEPAPASVGELRIFGRPGGREIRIDGIEPTPDGDGGLLFPLPGDEGRWRMVLEEDSAADGGELPSAWVLHSQILLRYVDGRLL